MTGTNGGRMRRRADMDPRGQVSTGASCIWLFAALAMVCGTVIVVAYLAWG
jgi:hypothetical protein